MRILLVLVLSVLLVRPVLASGEVPDFDAMSAAELAEYEDRNSHRPERMLAMANWGYTDAMINLYMIYTSSRSESYKPFEEGIETDDQCRALYWLDRAARAGDSLGQLNLALRYSNGRGVKQNHTLSYYWFQYALQNPVWQDEYPKTIAEVTSSVPPENRDDWKKIRPEDMPPAEIFDYPWFPFAGMISVFTGNKSCRWINHYF